VASPNVPAPFDVFLSYHSGDAEWVGTVKTALEAKGLRVWIDREQLRPGDLFPSALARAVDSVNCVVLVLSRGSIASAWVEEEYNLALANRRRVVPVLIDDVEPPGFLKGRTWVDFRDPDRFAASVDELVFGITGRRPDGTAPPPAESFRDAPTTDGAADEAVILQRLIARRQADVRRLWLTRVTGGVGGAALGGGFLVLAADAAPAIRIAVLALGLAIPVVAGWGVTARGLSRLAHQTEQFQIMRDGLDACRSRSNPGCMRLRQRFWDMMLVASAGAALDPGHE
jgi:hypothetical protein